jgi:hypothetical protein
MTLEDVRMLHLPEDFRLFEDDMCVVLQVCVRVGELDREVLTIFGVQTEIHSTSSWTTSRSLLHRAAGTEDSYPLSCYFAPILSAWLFSK